jgi:hypothetical protein
MVEQSEESALKSMWAGGVCADCGEVIVLGSGVTRPRIGQGSVLLCHACAARPVTDIRPVVVSFAGVEAAGLAPQVSAEDGLSEAA